MVPCANLYLTDRWDRGDVRPDPGIEFDVHLDSVIISKFHNRIFSVFKVSFPCAYTWTNYTVVSKKAVDLDWLSSHS
jgi:hypothetical protein